MNKRATESLVLSLDIMGSEGTVTLPHRKREALRIEAEEQESLDPKC